VTTNTCHDAIPFPNSSIVFVVSVRTSTKAENDARRNLASTASKCLSLHQKTDHWKGKSNSKVFGKLIQGKGMQYIDTSQTPGKHTLDLKKGKQLKVGREG
jgi:hypothetical protein